MKRHILLIAFAVTISLSMAAQGNSQTQRQNQQRTGKQEQVRNQKVNRSEEHGQTVSTVARDTPSGPGKGAVVSNQARTRGEMKKAEKIHKKELKKQKALKRHEEGINEEKQQVDRNQQRTDSVERSTGREGSQRTNPGRK